MQIVRSPIKAPRVTEKASNLSAQSNAYVFDVSPFTGKQEIKEAIFSIYKVRPVKINVLPVPYKSTIFKGRKGRKGGGRKAVVYLKKGDKINEI